MSNVHELIPRSQPTKSDTSALIHTSFIVETHITKMIQEELDDASGCINNHFIRKVFSLYYNSVMINYRGRTLVFPGLDENYNISQITHDTVSGNRDMLTLSLNTSREEYLQTIITYTSATSLGDVLRESFYFYHLFLSRNKGEHKPYVYGFDDSYYLEDILLHCT